MSEIEDINKAMKDILEEGIEVEVINIDGEKMCEFEIEALIEMMGLYYFRN